MTTYQQSMEHCPQCGTSTTLLHPIDTGMHLRLQKENLDIAFDAVCTACFKSLSKSVSNASYLQAEKQIQENFKRTLWKTRLNLFREARNCISQQRHAEAAANFEKYLKTIEYVYEKKREELSPGLFKDKPREVTLVASALWTLVEIYDLHPAYHQRQLAAAQKLGEFVSYTNLFSNVIKTSTLRLRSAKNPAAYKKLLQAANVNSSRCFIASAVFPEKSNPTIFILRRFRGKVLQNYLLGRLFIGFYYRFSPAIAFRLHSSPRVQKMLQWLLPKIAVCLKRIFNLQ